jgi:hypothetical protein
VFGEEGRSSNEVYQGVQCDKDTIIEGLMKLFTHHIRVASSSRILSSETLFASSCTSKNPCLTW